MCFGFISVLLRWLQRAGDTYAKDACASFVKDFNDSMEEAKECVKKARNCLATELAALVRFSTIPFNAHIPANHLFGKLLGVSVHILRSKSRHYDYFKS